MALPRLDYQPKDYIGAVGESLGGIAKTVDQLSPMDPRLQEAMIAVASGEDPKVWAGKLRGGGAPTPQMPQAQPPTATPQMPAQGPIVSGAVSQAPTMPSFSEDITVTAPRQVKEQAPAPTAPALPFARRDMPTLLSLAQIGGRRDPGMMDLRGLEYELRRDQLRERQRQFDAQEGLRAAREDLAIAQASGIPARIRQAEERNRIAEFNAMTGRGNLETRQIENYMKGAGDALEAVGNFETLLQRAEADPELAVPDAFYFKQRLGEMLSGLPLGAGKFLQESIKYSANERLSQAQLTYRQQAAMAMQSFIRSEFGKQVTGTEKQMADMLAGEMLSFADTMAGMRALKVLLGNRIERFKRAYPKAAEVIGEPSGELPTLPTNPELSNIEQADVWRRGASSWNYQRPAGLGLPSGSLLPGDPFGLGLPNPFDPLGITDPNKYKFGTNLPEVPGWDPLGPTMPQEPTKKGQAGQKGRR